MLCFLWATQDPLLPETQFISSSSPFDTKGLGMPLTVFTSQQALIKKHQNKPCREAGQINDLPEPLLPCMPSQQFQARVVSCGTNTHWFMCKERLLRRYMKMRICIQPIFGTKACFGDKANGYFQHRKVFWNLNCITISYEVWIGPKQFSQCIHCTAKLVSLQVCVHTAK